MNRVPAVLSFLLSLVAALAAQGDSGTKVRVKRAVLDRATLVLDLKIEPSWHIYAVNSDGTVGNATKVAVDGPYEISGPIEEPAPKHHKKDYLDEDTKEVIYTEEYDAHEGEITVRVPVRGPVAGALKGSLDVTACDANVCLPPGKVRFSVAAGAAESGTTASPGTAAPGGGAAPDSPVARQPGRKVVANPKRLGKFKPDDPVSIVEVSYPDPIGADRFDVHVVLEIKPEYHVYGVTKNAAGTGVPTTFLFGAAEGSEPAVVLVGDGDVRSAPAPKRREKKFEKYEYFDGRVAFDVPARATWAPGKARTGESPFAFRLSIEYQTCTMDLCLLPATATFDLTGNAAGLTQGVAIGDGAKIAGAGDAPLSVTLFSEPTPLRPDSSGVLVARIRRADGKPLKADGVEPRFDLGQGQNLFVEGAVTAVPDADGSVVLRLPVRVAADAPDARVAVSGRVALGAMTTPFTGQVEVMAPLLGFLVIAALAALFALLTPCVFPMIPVTISFFTKQAETGRSHPAKLAFLYSAGIVVSFTLIGALFSAVLRGDAANAFAGHWITQLVIGGLFIFFALSLFGLFDLSVPAPIMQMVERTTTRRMEMATEGKGVPIAVLLMGFLFSITTFTCTAPFIGGLLAGASASGQFGRPILGMLVFSAVLAVPFFFLALFPSQLKKLPKAGGWLNETKVVMGFVELSAAVKFLNGADLSLGWNVFTRNVCLAMWIAIFGLTALYLIGIIRLPKDMPRQKTGVIPLMLSILFTTIAIYLTTGLNGKPLGVFVEGWLPPIEEQFSHAEVASGPGTHGEASGERVGWDGRFEDDFEGALKEAQRKNLPLFVDFTGWTCANCRAVEAAIFKTNRDVRQLLRGFVVAELHLDGSDPVKDKNAALAQKLGLPNAMPFYVVMNATDQSVVNTWGWANADPVQWKQLVRDAFQRWKTLKD